LELQEVLLPAEHSNISTLFQVLTILREGWASSPEMQPSGDTFPSPGPQVMHLEIKCIAFKSQNREVHLEKEAEHSAHPIYRNGALVFNRRGFSL